MGYDLIERAWVILKGKVSMVKRGQNFLLNKLTL
jgi:hypothetical protein